VAKDKGYQNPRLKLRLVRQSEKAHAWEEVQTYKKQQDSQDMVKDCQTTGLFRSVARPSGCQMNMG